MLRESNPICRVARSADQLVDRFDTEQADVAVFAGLEKTSVFHLVNRRNRDVAEHFAGNREPDPFPLRVRDYGNFSFCSHWLHLSCEARCAAIGPSKKPTARQRADGLRVVYCHRPSMGGIVRQTIERDRLADRGSPALKIVSSPI
jgi:hypothetical protein